SAMQAMKFARLDFEKFLGYNVVAEIVETLDIDNRLAASELAAERMSNALNNQSQSFSGLAARRDGRQLVGFDPSREEIGLDGGLNPALATEGGDSALERARVAPSR